MEKALNVHEAMDIMREDQRQFEETAAELKSKQAVIRTNDSISEKNSRQVLDKINRV